MGKAWAVVSGTATIGAEGAEELAPPNAPWRRARASTILALFSSLSIIPAQDKHKKTILCKAQPHQKHKSNSTKRIMRKLKQATVNQGGGRMETNQYSP